MSFHSFSKHWLTLLSMCEFSKRVKETIILMSFDEFSKHWLTIPSMFEFSKRVKETIFSCHSMIPVLIMGLPCERVKKTICLMPFDEFSKHWLTILSMFEFSKRLKETIFLHVTKHKFTILSMFDFSKRVKDIIF
jgi:hypothetical protein